MGSQLWWVRGQDRVFRKNMTNMANPRHPGHSEPSTRNPERYREEEKKFEAVLLLDQFLKLRNLEKIIELLLKYDWDPKIAEQGYFLD